MSLIVQKFGGTSIGNLDRIQSVARKVKNEVEKGHQVAVVVSAMAGVTNQLIKWIYGSTSKLPDSAEYDMVVSTGEQVTSGMLALVLQDMGIPARSWAGWQVPIYTDTVHRQAHIESVNPDNILQSLNTGHVSVVAGFQGVDKMGRITTLGRGGSDTTAVALAHALEAERCDIYTDVDGIYTADPRVVPLAQRRSYVTYDQMLELSFQGAKVLHPDSVALAMRHKIPLRVLSSFDKGEGTYVTFEKNLPASYENHSICGLALRRNLARITLSDVPDPLKLEANIFDSLARKHIPVNMIVQTCHAEGAMNVTFTVPEEESEMVKDLLIAHKKMLGYSQSRIEKNVAKISIIGKGFKENQVLIQTLADHKIPVKEMSSSEMSFHLLVSHDHADFAIKTLHETLGLDGKETVRVAA